MQVLDAQPLLVYLQKKPGYEKVRDLFSKLAESDKKILITTVNWGEVYYVILREKGLEEAEQIMQIVDTFPIELVEIDRVIAKQAAIYKTTAKMSYADCFAAALAKIKKAELITGDKEFKQFENEIKIIWIT